MMNFVLIGDGYAAQFHRQAIERLGGEILSVYDPKYEGHTDRFLANELSLMPPCWTVICSPSHLHKEHIEMALRHNYKVIVEKPLRLPWQPIIDDDRVNVVLQYRWADLPKKADMVSVTMVRDDDYWKSWKGNPQMTGGAFFNLFIHYIDLAIQLNANFKGRMFSSGHQQRRVDDIDLMGLDMNDLYFKMYNDIVNHDKGVKPKDLFYLHWLLNRNGCDHGFGRGLINKTIHIPRELL